MPVWLTLLGGTLATLAFLGGIFGLVIVFIQGKATKGQPKFGLFSSGGNGTIGAYVTWDPATFDVKIYRFRFWVVSPEWSEKEMTFTFSYENPQQASFGQVFQLPPNFLKLLADPKAKAIIAVEARSSEEFALSKDFTVKSFRRLYEGAKQEMGKGPATLAAIGPDLPAVMSLDYAELVERRKKLKSLEAAANAKAAKKAAPAAPAAAKPAAETTV